MPISLHPVASHRIGSAVYCMASDGNRGVFLGLSSGYVAHIADPVTGEGKAIIKLASPVFSLHFNLSDDKLMAGSQHGELVLFDWNNKLLVNQTSLPSGCFSIVTYFDNYLIASGPSGILQWNPEANDLPSTLFSRDASIRSLWSDGNRLLSGWSNGHIIDLMDDGIEVKSHESTVFSLAAAGEYILSGGKDAYLNLYDRGLQLLSAIPAHWFTINSICTIADNLIATGSRDKTIKLWSVPELGLSAKADAGGNGHTHSVNALHWLAQSGLLLSGGDDGYLRCWKIQGL